MATYNTFQNTNNPFLANANPLFNTQNQSQNTQTQQPSNNLQSFMEYNNYLQQGIDPIQKMKEAEERAKEAEAQIAALKSKVDDTIIFQLEKFKEGKELLEKRKSEVDELVIMLLSAYSPTANKLAKINEKFKTKAKELLEKHETKNTLSFDVNVGTKNEYKDEQTIEQQPTKTLQI